MSAGRERSVALACALAIVVVAILWAGLRPFDWSRPNGVSWSVPGPGLRFADGGLAHSNAALRWESGPEPAPVSIELWLRPQPTRNDELRDFLTLLDGTPEPPLRIGQAGPDLVVNDRITNADGHHWYNSLRVPNVLRAGARHHIVVASSARGPRVFIDGRATELAEGYPIPLARAGEAFGGRLLLGSDPRGTAPWSGEIIGLALYRGALGAEDVARHAAGGLPSVDSDPRLLGLLAFDERDGVVARDRVSDAHHLVLPDSFRPLGRQALVLPDTRYLGATWNLVDASFNLVGFVPLGLALGFVLRRHSALRGGRLLAVATLAGFALSLAIELTQVLMVSRRSTLQDLVLNTLGAFAGAWLVEYRVRRRRTARP